MASYGKASFPLWPLLSHTPSCPFPQIRFAHSLHPSSSSSSFSRAPSLPHCGLSLPDVCPVFCGGRGEPATDRAWNHVFSHLSLQIVRPLDAILILVPLPEFLHLDSQSSMLLPGLCCSVVLSSSLLPKKPRSRPKRTGSAARGGQTQLPRRAPEPPALIHLSCFGKSLSSGPPAGPGRLAASLAWPLRPV